MVWKDNILEDKKIEIPVIYKKNRVGKVIEEVSSFYDKIVFKNDEQRITLIDNDII